MNVCVRVRVHVRVRACPCVCVCTKFRGQDSQPVALNVKLFEMSQLSYLLRQRDEIIIPQTQLEVKKQKEDTLLIINKYKHE